VKKTSGGTTTVFVYDAQGQLAAEYSSGAGSGAGRNYLTVDHLGSTRLITDGTGAVLERHDYRPFGDEVTFGTGSVRAGIAGYGVDLTTRLKFTGKERDVESGLDYFGARYLSSAQGRFTSTDPGPFIWGDPQTLDRYSYTRDNPLKFVDPTGRYFVVSSGDQKFFTKTLTEIYQRPGGRELVNTLATSDRPVLLNRGELNATTTGDVGVSKALTLTGQAGVAGVQTTIGTDADLFNGAKMAPGKVGSAITTAHELEHDKEGLSKGQSSVAAGTAAMASGDASSSAGKKDTLGGTAQAGAADIMGQKPDMSPAEAGAAVQKMMQSGQEQWQKSDSRSAICSQNNNACH
jgi:RHS repeat-associated protein